MNDVIVAQNPRLLDIAAQLKTVHTHLGLGSKLCAVIPVAGQRTHGTTFRAFKVTSRVATTGAESAVYDCLVAIGAGSCKLSINAIVQYLVIYPYAPTN